MGRLQIPLDLVNLVADRLRKLNRKKGADQLKTPSSSPSLPFDTCSPWTAADRRQAGSGTGGDDRF
jgi:hypothetical protein